VMAAEEDWKMIEQVGSRPGRGGAAGAARAEGRTWSWTRKGDSALGAVGAAEADLSPDAGGHTPGVVTERRHHGLRRREARTRRFSGEAPAIAAGSPMQESVQSANKCRASRACR